MSKVGPLRGGPFAKLFVAFMRVVHDQGAISQKRYYHNVLDSAREPYGRSVHSAIVQLAYCVYPYAHQIPAVGRLDLPRRVVYKSK